MVAGNVLPAGAAEQVVRNSGKVEEIIVIGKTHDELGSKVSASVGVVGKIELSRRPVSRPGEVLEFVPGMIITAHAGGGKANQYYLRGFNLDHGTDFATGVDGVPVNMGTHAHGQGYTDINWLIPELIDKVDFRKGPYYAEVGDFGNAGSANIQYVNALPHPLAEAEAGSYGYYRLLAAGSTAVGEGHVLVAGEYTHDDGPWQVPNDYKKRNALLRYTLGDADSGGGASFLAYRGTWNGTDQVPQRAIDSGLIDRFGTLDPSVGGDTHRYSASGDWHWRGDSTLTRAQIYFVDYRLKLLSNFTYFLDQDHGDGIEQNDRRQIAGGSLAHTAHGTYLGRSTEDVFGFQSRNDFVRTRLDNQQAGQIISIVRHDSNRINQLSPWWQNSIQWTDWLRTTGGLRMDSYFYHVVSNDPRNSGHASSTRVSPKAGLTLGPWANTELYVQAGLGVRTNDARGIVGTANPVTGDPVGQVLPLVRTRGAEIGVRWKSAKLTTTAALWILESDSELFFTGDSGAVEDSSRPGRRYGIEWNTIYNPLAWVNIDVDLATSRARFTDNLPGSHIPEAVRSMASLGISLHDHPALPGGFASLRLRYMGPRDLVEDGSVESKSSTVLNARFGYEINPHISLGLEVLNVADAKYNDAEYYYSARLAGEPANPASDDGGYDDHMVHAGLPRQIRLAVTVKL